MKDKLVFVKDKIIQFIQVRWSHQFMHLWACVYHGYISTMVKGEAQASFAHRSPQESHLGESSLLPLENLQFSFESRALFSRSLLLTHALLREFLCPLLLVFFLLKSAVCTHFHGLPDMYQLSVWMWTSAFMRVLCALAPALRCGRGAGWWLGVSPSYCTCAASELWVLKPRPTFPNSEFPHPEAGIAGGADVSINHRK